MLLNIFFKTGELRDKYDSWDGDDGYYERINVPYETIDPVLVDFIYEDYFAEQKIAESEEDKVKAGIKQLLDFSMEFYEYYRDQLEEYFSEHIEEL